METILKVMEANEYLQKGLWAVFESYLENRALVSVVVSSLEDRLLYTRRYCLKMISVKFSTQNPAIRAQRWIFV